MLPHIGAVDGAKFRLIRMDVLMALSDGGWTREYLRLDCGGKGGPSVGVDGRWLRARPLLHG